MRAIEADALPWLYPLPGRILALGLRQTARAVALLRLVRGAHVHPQNYPRNTLGRHCIFLFFYQSMMLRYRERAVAAMLCALRVEILRRASYQLPM
jgi:hypothetical protein